MDSIIAFGLVIFSTLAGLSGVSDGVTLICSPDKAPLWARSTPRRFLIFPPGTLMSSGKAKNSHLRLLGIIKCGFGIFFLYGAFAFVSKLAGIS